MTNVEITSASKIGAVNLYRHDAETQGRLSGELHTTYIAPRAQQGVVDIHFTSHIYRPAL